MTFLTTPEGVRLRVCERGEGGREIVLVHGWKMSHRAFDHPIQRLSQRFRVVSYDLRGMGESDKPNCRYDFDICDEVFRRVLRRPLRRSLRPRTRRLRRLSPALRLPRGSSRTRILIPTAIRSLTR